MPEALTSLLTPLIAVITVYIAYQQYRIRRDERRLVLYDRRLAIYKNVIGIIDRIRLTEPLDSEDVFNWLASTEESNFLFGPEVSFFIHELFGAILVYSGETEPIKHGDKQFDVACADATNLIEGFRGTAVRVFSFYLQPTSRFLGGPKQLSPKDVKAHLERSGIYENSKNSIAPSDEDDIPF